MKQSKTKNDMIQIICKEILKVPNLTWHFYLSKTLKNRQ